MKMLVGGLAAIFMATAALAQTAPPPTTDPMNSPSALPPAEATTPPASGAEAPTGPQLTQKDGKWWNGDRKATRTEIAQYKAANPKTPG